MTFPPDLRAFVDTQHPTFAKTMLDWPHEYLVRERVDERLFERPVVHVRTHGAEGRFYERVITYYEEAGLVYWTMGAPLPETIIVNRCLAKTLTSAAWRPARCRRTPRATARPPLLRPRHQVRD